MGSHEGPKTFISKRTPRETGSKAEQKKEDNRKEKFKCKTEREDCSCMLGRILWYD